MRISASQSQKLRTMTDAEIVAHYILDCLRRDHGNQWLSGPRKKVRNHINRFSYESTWLHTFGFSLTPQLQRRLIGIKTICQLFQEYFFRGIALDSHEGLVGWLEGRYPLVLTNEIPTPHEMLNIQCDGKRIVTLLPRPDQQSKHYGRHKSACAFTLHDLEHAHKFFGDEGCHRGQVRFFRGLRLALPMLQKWTNDEVFVRDLNYLMSDMNSHPVHLVKFLKAIVLTAEIRRSGNRHPQLENFFSELFRAWNMSKATTLAALCINQPERETEADRETIANFFLYDLDGKGVESEKAQSLI